MKNKRFLDLVLAHEGQYCLWALKGTRPNEQIKQQFYPSTDDLLQAARDLDNNGWNAFFALGTFFDDSSRTANNMQWMKSFFLDLDCGPDKEFPSQAVAIDELRNFCENNELPITTAAREGSEETTGFLGSGKDILKMMKKRGVYKIDYKITSPEKLKTKIKFDVILYILALC